MLPIQWDALSHVLCSFIPAAVCNLLAQEEEFQDMLLEANPDGPRNFAGQPIPRAQLNGFLSMMTDCGLIPSAM
jgi:hypothetical protein